MRAYQLKNSLIYNSVLGEHPQKYICIIMQLKNKYKSNITVLSAQIVYGEGEKERPIFAVLRPCTTSFSIIPIAVLMPQRSTLSCWARYRIEHLHREGTINFFCLKISPFVTNLDVASGWISCHIWSHNSRIRTGDLTMFLWFATRRKFQFSVKLIEKNENNTSKYVHSKWNKNNSPYKIEF